MIGDRTAGRFCTPGQQPNLFSQLRELHEPIEADDQRHFFANAPTYNRIAGYRKNLLQLIKRLKIACSSVVLKYRNFIRVE